MQSPTVRRRRRQRALWLKPRPTGLVKPCWTLRCAAPTMADRRPSSCSGLRSSVGGQGGSRRSVHRGRTRPRRRRWSGTALPPAPRLRAQPSKRRSTTHREQDDLGREPEPGERRHRRSGWCGSTATTHRSTFCRDRVSVNATVPSTPRRSARSGSAGLPPMPSGEGGLSSSGRSTNGSGRTPRGRDTTLRAASRRFAA